jgi:hypothetical protein
MTTQLFNPEIVIQNKKIVFKANSFKLKLGQGEIKVEALSGGGGYIETAHTEDVSTKVSEFSGMLSSTTENYEFCRQLKQLVGGISITISEGDFHASLRNMSLVNDPELQFKTEPEVEFQFKGDPVL